MKPSESTLRNTGHIAVGVALLVALMLGVFAALGRFSASALWGSIYTGVLAVLNFFILGLTVQSITDTAGEKERTEEEIQQLSQKMSARMQTSKTLRTFGMLGLVVLGIAVFRFDPLATILPMLFPTLTIHGMQIIQIVLKRK